MAVLIVLCTFVLLGVVVLFVSAPLREAAARRARGGQEEPQVQEKNGDDADRSELSRLEVARETKYREIRDAELDYRTGKLSERDYRELDAELRAEALEILDRIEAEGATPRDASEG